MTDQTIAGDVGGCANETTLGEIGAYGVNFRHERDDFFLEPPRSEPALDCGGGNACAQRFC